MQSEKGEEFFEAVVSYLCYATKIDINQYVQAMRTISPNIEEKFISTAMKLEMKGEKKEEKKD